MCKSSSWGRGGTDLVQTNKQNKSKFVQMTKNQIFTSVAVLLVHHCSPSGTFFFHTAPPPRPSVLSSLCSVLSRCLTLLRNRSRSLSQTKAIFKMTLCLLFLSVFECLCPCGTKGHFFLYCLNLVLSSRCPDCSWSYKCYIWWVCHNFTHKLLNVPFLWVTDIISSQYQHLWTKFNNN